MNGTRSCMSTLLIMKKLLTAWTEREICHPHSQHLWRHDMHAWSPLALRFLLGSGKDAVYSITIPVSSGYWRIITKTTENERNGIQWTVDDLSYALLSHNLRQLQEKTSDAVHRRKTKILRVTRHRAENLVTLRESHLMRTWIILVTSVVLSTSKEAPTRTSKWESKKARMHDLCYHEEYLKLKEHHYPNQTEAVLLYSSDTWRLTKASTEKFQVSPTSVYVGFYSWHGQKE